MIPNFVLGPNQLKWIEALESGKYQQGMEYLCYLDTDEKTKKYCCLGVGCDVFGVQETGVEDGVIVFGDDKYTSYRFADAVKLYDREGHPQYVFPDDEKRLNEFIRKIIPYFDQDENEPISDLFLVNMNDTGKFSFENIAKILRKFPHIYFRESA